MRILFTAGRELSYPRNALIIKLLNQKYSLKTIGKNFGRASISRQSLVNIIKGIPAIRKADLLMIGFFGHFQVLPLRIFTKKPILFDAFVSAYDTLCYDRKLFKPQSIQGILAYWLDKTACSLANRIILDTLSHIKYFSKEFRIPIDKFDVLYVGCDDDIFYPRDFYPCNGYVLFYGSFLPLHGIDVITKAAELVSEVNPEISFKLIGADKTFFSSSSFKKTKKLTNVDFLPPVPFNSLPELISRASICLGGHFGNSQKASRVIAGKTFQFLAMGKPVIVSDNSANRELLTHAEDAWMCKRDDPYSLADSILHIYRNKDLQYQLAFGARKTYLAKASNPILSMQLDEIIKHVNFANPDF